MFFCQLKIVDHQNVVDYNYNYLFLLRMSKLKLSVNVYIPEVKVLDVNVLVRSSFTLAPQQKSLFCRQF